VPALDTAQKPKNQPQKHVLVPVWGTLTQADKVMLQPIWLSTKGHLIRRRGEGMARLYPCRCRSLRVVSFLLNI